MKIYRLLLLIACSYTLFTIHAYDSQEAYVYFDGTGWNQSYVYCCVGKEEWQDDWTNLFKMQEIDHTQLYYAKTEYFGGATYMAFIGTEDSWGSGAWATWNISNAQKYTAPLFGYVLNWHQYYLFIPNDSYNNNAAITGNFLGGDFFAAQGMLNNTQTICAYISEDKGASYQEAAFPAKATISSYELSSFPSTTQLVYETLLPSDNQARCQIPAVYTATVTCTIDMTGISDYIFEGWYDNAGGLVSTNYSYSYTASREARTYQARFKKKVYRLVSILQDESQLYSNEVLNTGDTMSVYTQLEGSLQLQYYGESDWVNVGNPTHHVENNVIVAPLVLADDGTVSVGTVSNYTGDYYIRTDVANGGWNNYKTNADNKFTYFEANRTFGNETYNHYWVKYFEGERNTKAAVANDYNESLADELGDEYRNNMNVRFSYDNTTNSFNRVYLERSIVGDNPNPTFLQIFGTNIYTSEGGEISETGKQSFTDISNWVYEFNLKAQPEAKITIVANNNSERLVEDAVILGENSSFGGEFGNERYDMRVIYDFKKNRWVASWLPNLSDMTITEGMEIHVDANMMLVRNHNNKVNSFNITDANSYIDQIQHIYFVMELERDTLFNNDGSRKFSHLFWFSLPYSCKISEIFGIEGYNKKWVIQRYRGDKRAEYSWTTNIETFWANMNSTATLEPNRGYALSLNLSRDDFQNIGGKSVLRLYFPSVEENFKLSQSSSNTEVNVPAHECNVNGRDSVDSHWNVIGIPGFQPVNMESYSDQSGFDAFAGYEAPNFLYEWKGTHDAYEVVSGTSITYQHFYSYMVQFAGTIDWGQFTQGTSETTPAAVRAQRSQQAYRQDTYRINLTGEDADDRTFIRLSTDGTEGYVTNQDLEKINNSQLAQIYTLGAGTRLAANTLPRETQAVSVGLNIPANGTYTLSLDENGQSVTAILYDKWENVYTDLSRDSYEFTQMEGRCEDRFEIQFSAEPTVPTDVEEANAAFIRLDGRTLRIVGGNDGGNVAVYDMAGRCLLRTQLTADFSFEIPVSGVYVLDIQGKKHKVVIK